MNNKDYLAHYGIKGQKWGLRRYQNPDGTYTAAGKARRNKGTGKTSYGKGGGGGGGNSGWMYDDKYDNEGSARSAVRADITSRNAKQILDSEKGIASSLRDATDAVDNLNRSRQISKYRQTGIDPNVRDDEIQRAINRMDVENRFYDQKYRYDTQGKARASDALKLIGGLTAAAAGTALVASMIRKNNLDAARIKKAIYGGKKLSKEEKKALKEQQKAEKKAKKEYDSDTNAYEWWLGQAAYAKNNNQYNNAMSNAMLMLSHRDKKPMTYTDLEGKKHTVIYDASMLETMYNGSKQNTKYGKNFLKDQLKRELGDMAEIDRRKYEDTVKLAQAKQKAKTTVKKAKLKAKTDQAVAKAKNLSTDYNKDGTLTDKGRDKLIRQLVKNEQVIRSATRSVRNADKFGNVTGAVVPLASMGLLGAVSPAVMAAFPATAGIGGAMLAGTAIKKLSSTGVKALGQKEIESANVKAASLRNRLDEDDRKRRAMAHSEDFLAHYGIKGQKWGVRRFQNSDGSYTHEGKVRYGRIKSSGKKPKYGYDYDDYGGSSYDKYVSRANRGSSDKDYSYKMNLTPNSKLRTAGTVLAGLALASMGTKYLVKNLDDLYTINKLDKHAVENSMKIMDLKNANKMKKIEANYKKGNVVERAYRKVKSVKLNKALKKDGKVNSDTVLLNRRGVRKYIKKHGGLTTTEQKVNTALSQVGSRYPDSFEDFRKSLQKPTYAFPKTDFKMTNGTGGIPSRKTQKAINRAARKRERVLKKTEKALSKPFASMKKIPVVDGKRQFDPSTPISPKTQKAIDNVAKYRAAQTKLNRANDEFDKIFDEMNKTARKKGREFRKWGNS